jgi:hypothetical protein
MARSTSSSTSSAASSSMRRLTLFACLAAATALPDVDRVHSLMEPPMPKSKPPRVSGARMAVDARRAGFMKGPAKIVLLLPALVGVLTVQFPDAMRRVLQHAICYFGSLIDPWHMVLPEKHFLQFFVRELHAARKAYDEKHGIVRIDETQFFDDEDEEEEEDEEDGEAEASEEADDEAGDDDGDDGDGDDGGADDDGDAAMDADADVGDDDEES